MKMVCRKKEYRPDSPQEAFIMNKEERQTNMEAGAYREALRKIAVPVTLQSLLGSSFSMADQVMTGQLGSTCVAGIGLAGKFFSVFSVVIAAVASVAGIMMAQYLGKGKERETGRSFYVNLLLALAVAVLFLLACMILPEKIMSLYSTDAAAIGEAAAYLRILGLSAVPMAVVSMLAALLRCREAAKLPLIASIAAAVCNTVGNYVLIFGKFGFPALGARGAAIATVTAQFANMFLLFFLHIRMAKRKELRLPFLWRLDGQARIQYAKILLPMLACEVLWVLGENIYATIYGHIGTAACAAMTLTAPIQGLLIGALTGLSQAASVITGKALGSGEYDRAYRDGKRLLVTGLLGAGILSLLVVALSPYYVQIYQVEDAVRLMTRQILLVYAFIAPVKVLNMILGSGILRSGGKTNYVMYIDFIGTWLFGVPLGLLAAFVLKLPIAGVYLMLSLEECVRLVISLVLFRKKVWMSQLA